MDAVDPSSPPSSREGSSARELLPSGSEFDSGAPTLATIDIRVRPPLTRRTQVYPVAWATGVEDSHSDSILCYRPQPKPPPGSAWTSYRTWMRMMSGKQAILTSLVCTRVSSH